MQRILIVEDETKLARMLDLELGHEGYQTIVAYDGQTALDIIRIQKPDLVLLDIILPVKSGMEVMHDMLQEHIDIPVIMLTAKVSLEDRISGLDAGACDYITKPFHIEELLARIRATLRTRSEKREQKVLKIGTLTLDPDGRTVYIKDESISLTRLEFNLLQCLMENRGHVLSRSALSSAVWGYDYYNNETNTIDVYISFLRNKIHPKLGYKLIETVRGIGYVIR